MAEAIFRSAMAEKLGCAPSELADRGLMVMSAGISASMGGRASPEAVVVLNKQGIDLSAHESQPLTEQLVRHADLILPMTRSHRQAILNEWPEVADRVKLVSHSGADVGDPIGGPPELYERCAAQIKADLLEWAKEIDVK